MKVGRKQQLNREQSRKIVNAACNKIGLYNLSKRLGISHPHLSRARTGEEGISKQLANKLLAI